MKFHTANTQIARSALIVFASALAGCTSDPSPASRTAGEAPDISAPVLQTSAALLAPDPCGDTSGLQQGSAWPMRGGCPARLGRSPNDGADQNNANWAVTLAGPIYSSPVIRADGSIVIGSDSGQVFAISPDDGHLLWSRTLWNFVHSSPAVARDGTIYIGAHTDRLHALRGTDGQELWSFETLLDISSSPVVAGDGTIYVGSENGSLYALNPNGTMKWQYWTAGVVRTSPAIGPDGVVYYGSDYGEFYALRPDGTLKWKFGLWDFVRSSAAVSNGVVYFGSDANKLHALRASDGAVLWEKEFPLSDVVSSPAVAPDGTIYIGADDGKLHAIRPNGTERWAYATGGAIWSSPIVDKSGRIYFGSNDDYIYALRPNGTLLWRYKTWGDVISSPAIGARGEVIVGSADSWLYSIGSSDRSSDSDCDGIADSRETLSGLDPLDPSDAEEDSDNDGIENELEIALGGDPLAADTDGDGQADDPDIFSSTDLDGDGDPFAGDNCPVVANPNQEDADLDGVGDLCDEVSAGASNAPAPVAIGRTSNGRYAAWRLDVLDMGRMRRDLRGLRATGSTFRIFSASFTGSREVVEMFHPTTGLHVYTATAAEVQSFKASGYQRLGVLGYLAPTAPALGQAVRVRRFRNPQGREAISADAAEATALLAAGYQELAALGHGLRDYGDLRNPDSVVRFRNVSTSRIVHTSAGPAEDLAGFATEGQQFSIFPGPSGWTVPLYRLRNAAGDEVLSTTTAQPPSLSGYQNEGVIGYVFPASGSVQSLHPLVSLFRLRSPAGRHEHRASLAEARALIQQGYTSETIARVVAAPGSAPGGECAGEPAITDQIAAAVAPLPADKRPAYVLLRFAQACAIVRALAGQASTPAELAIASMLNGHDPYTRAEVRRWADQTLSLTTPQRAALLGELAEFDPGNCSQPIENGAIGQVTQAIVSSCTGTSGAPSHISFATLRAPHCAGVTYAAGDIGAEDAARAVVASIGDPGCSELCPPGGSFTPDVHGVLMGGHVPTGSAAAAFGASHEKVGLSTRGVDVGPCGGQNSCVPDLGQACVGGRCMQYPIVPSGTDAVFSASNVWDVVTAQIDFTEIDPTTRMLLDEPLPPVNVCVSIPAFQPGEDRSLRCEPFPVNYSGASLPSENRLEQLSATSQLALAPGKFYRVRAINKNGSFYQNESVPVDPNDIAETGRTVHVCDGPRCTPTLIDSNAVCELASMPACGSLGGTIWNQPPRSLEACRAINPLFSPCEETPYEFAGGDGIIYVDDPRQPRFVQTRLSGIHCNDETGRTNRPNVNPDEVIVAFASVTSDLPNLADLEDQGGGFGVVKFDLNAGNRRRPDKVLGSVRIGLDDFTESVLMVGEDDWISVKQWAIAHSAGIVASAFGLFGGWQAAVAAGAAAELGTLTGLVLKDAPDPDDPIGRAVWSQTIVELQDRGLLAHDSNISNAVPLLTRIPSFQRYIVSEQAGRHPGVDLVAYSSNSDLVSCADNSTCTNGRVCRLGACVPSDWTDRTLPRDYDPQLDAAGTMERLEMNGSRSNYRVYISTSLSSKDARE